MTFAPPMLAPPPPASALGRLPMTDGSARRRRTRHIVIHITATPPSWPTGPQAVNRIDEDHKARGWKGIGYNEVVTRCGSVLPGRGSDAIGAHARGYNSQSIGVALMGGVDDDLAPDMTTITTAQWRALEARVMELVQLYPDAVVCGHRDLSPDLDGDGVIDPGEWTKICPGFDAIPWAAARGLPAAKIHGAWTSRDARRPAAPDVRHVDLQNLLKAAGYEIGADDGIVGPRTRAAIRAFQADNRLPQTGEFDRLTIDVLKRVTQTAPAQPPRGETPGLVDGGVSSGGLLALVGAALGYLGDLDWRVLCIGIIALAVLAGLVFRAQANAADTVAKALAGDPIPEPEPDALDWLWSFLRALLSRLAAEISAAIRPRRMEA